MSRDELEFAISQYLDGTLAEVDQAALEARLASDAGARQVLGDYRRVDAALRGAPLPSVRWDALADEISAAVSREPEPAQSYRMPWVRAAVGMAVAACIVAAASISIRQLLTSTQGPNQTAGQLPAPEPLSIVVVDAAPGPAPSTRPALVVEIGPPRQPQGQPRRAWHDQDLISRPSQVLIARSGYAAQDSSFLP